MGGLTRLTNSGLSITEWELFSGIFPPTNNVSWEKYFALYKEIPQYKLVNYNMTIGEFKIIFYWEYFHRILGRLVGLFFLIPLSIFCFIKLINKNYISNSLIIFILIVVQGLIGWYMVKSGLVNNTTVSHYRLSLHLSIAFIIISMIFWNILNYKNKIYKKFFIINKKNFPFILLISLIFIQVIAGAFVSGLDAGRLYQTWPLMNYHYFPNDYEVKSIKDLFNTNNHSLVQFYHRNLAYLIFFYIVIFGYFIFKNNYKDIFKSFYLVSFFLILQIVLGIFTLISGLNIYLASLHQICSLFLILSVINLYYKYIN